MNWKKVVKYPESLSLFCAINNIDQSELCEQHIVPDNRQIYEFFDNHDVFIFITPCTTSINYGEKPINIDGFAFCLFYKRDAPLGKKKLERYNMDDIKKPYESRGEAEAKAFEKAFEILNNLLD